MSDLGVKGASETGTFAALSAGVEGGSAGERERSGAVRAAAGGSEMPAAAKTDLESLTAKLNLASETIGRDLRFEVDMDSGRAVIQVLDRETGEIIRQIPPEKADVTLTRNGFVELKLYDGNA